MWRAKAVRDDTGVELEEKTDIHCPNCGTKGNIDNFKYFEVFEIEPGNPHMLVDNSYMPVQ